MLTVNLVVHSHSLSVLSDILYSLLSSPLSSRPLDSTQSPEYLFTLSLLGGLWQPVSVFSVGVGSLRTESALPCIHCLSFISVLGAYASSAERHRNKRGLREEQDMASFFRPIRLGENRIYRFVSLDLQVVYSRVLGIYEISIMI